MTQTAHNDDLIFNSNYGEVKTSASAMANDRNDVFSTPAVTTMKTEPKTFETPTKLFSNRPRMQSQTKFDDKNDDDSSLDEGDDRKNVHVNWCNGKCNGACYSNKTRQMEFDQLNQCLAQMVHRV